MDDKEYNTYLRKISETKIGLEMVNHVPKCPECLKLLNMAQITIIKHIEKGNLKNEN